MNDNFKEFIYNLFLESLSETTNPPIVVPVPDDYTYLVTVKTEVEKKTVDALVNLSKSTGIPLHILLRSIINVITNIISEKQGRLCEDVRNKV